MPIREELSIRFPQRTENTEIMIWSPAAFGGTCTLDLPGRGTRVSSIRPLTETLARRCLKQRTPMENVNYRLWTGGSDSRTKTRVYIILYDCLAIFSSSSVDQNSVRGQWRETTAFCVSRPSYREYGGEFGRAYGIYRLTLLRGGESFMYI